MRKKLIAMLFLFGLIFMVISCASKKDLNSLINSEYSGKICVLDENNYPVSGFYYSIESVGKNQVSGFSDENGMINVPKGNWTLNGNKEGYSFVENQKVSISFGETILLQISGIDSVLQKTRQFYANGSYGEGIRNLETVYAKEGSCVARVLDYYRAAGIKKSGEEEKSEE